MKYSEANLGRVFVIRLEDGDILHEVIENFAYEVGVKSAALIALGGVDKDSILIVGPEEGRETPVVPMQTVLENVHEAAGTGTIFPDETGRPVLHMHLSAGRARGCVTGCVRRGVKVWHVLEVVMIELAGSTASRQLDDTTGFKLLSP